MVEVLTDDQIRALAAEIRIEFVDLNGDGKPEIIAQAYGLGPCGDICVLVTNGILLFRLRWGHLTAAA